MSNHQIQVGQEVDVVVGFDGRRYRGRVTGILPALHESHEDTLQLTRVREVFHGKEFPAEFYPTRFSVASVVEKES